MWHKFYDPHICTAHSPLSDKTRITFLDGVLSHSVDAATEISLFSQITFSAELSGHGHIL